MLDACKISEDIMIEEFKKYLKTDRIWTNANEVYSKDFSISFAKQSI